VNADVEWTLVEEVARNRASLDGTILMVGQGGMYFLHSLKDLEQGTSEQGSLFVVVKAVVVDKL